MLLPSGSSLKVGGAHHSSASPPPARSLSPMQSKHHHCLTPWFHLFAFPTATCAFLIQNWVWCLAAGGKATGEVTRGVGQFEATHSCPHRGSSGGQQQQQQRRECGRRLLEGDEAALGGPPRRPQLPQLLWDTEAVPSSQGPCRGEARAWSGHQPGDRAPRPPRWAPSRPAPTGNRGNRARCGASSLSYRRAGRSHPQAGVAAPWGGHGPPARARSTAGSTPGPGLSQDSRAQERAQLQDLFNN